MLKISFLKNVFNEDCKIFSNFARDLGKIPYFMAVQSLFD